MSNADELEAARRLIGQLRDTFVNLDGNLSSTVDGLGRLEQTLRADPDQVPFAGVIEAVAGNLRLDRQVIAVTLEHIRRSGFPPD